MVEIKDFVRPTQIARSVMRSHGKLSYSVYTNNYDKCRTVKCYHRGNAVELIGDIRTALIKAGVNQFSIKSLPGTNWVNRYQTENPIYSIIVRIPKTEQA